MKQDNNHNQNPHPDEDLRLATLGVHLSETSAGSACPDEQEMARMVDQATIDDPQFAHFFKHLNECEDCYHAWLSLTSIQKEGFTEKTLKHLKKPRSLSIMGSALAVAATVLIVFQLPSKDQLHKQISAPQAETQQYEMMQESQMSDNAFQPEEKPLPVPAQKAAPAAISELTRQAAESETRIELKKENTMQQSAQPVEADSAGAFNTLQSEIRQFCEQSFFDEKKKSQLLEMTDKLLQNEQDITELKVIKDIFSKMTEATKPQSCEQMQAYLKK